MTEMVEERNSNLLMVVPCFNEYRRFDVDYWKYVVEGSKNTQWLFVNDGSTDQTISLLKLLEDYGATILNLNRNSGKSNAIQAGIKSFGHFVSYIGYVDADSAFLNEEVLEFCESSLSMMESRESLDCVIASRVKLAGTAIIRSSSRHLLARLIASWLSLIWRDLPYDTQCGLKIFRNSPAFQDCMKSRFETRWLFDIEIFIRIAEFQKSRISILERPLSYWCEKGESKINLKEKLRIVREVLLISKLLKTLGSANRSQQRSGG